MLRTLLASVPLLLLAPPGGDDAVFTALDLELQRAMARLKLEQSTTPYYVGYTVRQTDTFTVSASFGAVAAKGRDQGRMLLADVRVGDYALDSSRHNAAEAMMFGGFGGGSLTVEDNLDALRHEIWIHTDREYKAAIEALESKKAALQQKQVKDRPDDFSKETPVTSVQAAATLRVDEERWVKASRRLSALFREYPRIQTSTVTFTGEAGTRWFVNSEGFRHRLGRTELTLNVAATAQADDGMRVSDVETFAARVEAELPGEEQLERAVRALAQRLSDLCQAPLLEGYRGPILFEGQAAAELFAQALAPHLGNAHETGEREGPQANPLKDKIGQKIAAGMLGVVDDPTLTTLDGVPLVSGYELDDDGVKGQRIVLVEKGVLKTFCMSRIPTRKVKQSNGHAKGSIGAVSTLLVETDKPEPAAALRKKLLELGQEEGLDHVLVVRRLSNAASALLDPSSFAHSLFGRLAAGGVALQPPVLVYRVAVADGAETLVRGARFGSVSMRILRDIVATGDDRKPHTVLYGIGTVGQLVTPSLLVKELELKEPPKELEKPPALPHPFFEK